MKNAVLIVLALPLAFAMTSCRSNQPADAAHNSRNSLNWEGVYTGVIPAAAGPGIEVRLTLYGDETYEISYHYIDREDSAFTQKGGFKWDRAGSVITLDTGDYPPYYKAGENTLTQLDMKGKPITGNLAENYVLRKKR
jgi:uncharacterized lipoprotein NlpE involved in copper resistance